jgi:hypothetical protein
VYYDLDEFGVLMYNHRESKWNWLKMKTIGIILSLVLVLLLTSACGTVKPIPSVPTKYQQLVNDLNTIKPVGDAPVVPGRAIGKVILPEDKWDINKYFQVLTHISMREGYILDWSYNFGGSGGYPTVYSWPSVDPRVNNDEYIEPSTGPITDNALNIEDTADGYFEYILFYIEGPRFYIFWHSVMDYREIICDATVLPGLYLGDSLAKAMSLNFEPKIELNEKTAKVSVMTFNGWKGFFRETYTIDRINRGKILDIEKDLMLKYRNNHTL